MNSTIKDCALVRLRICQFGNTEEDESITDEVRLKHALGQESGSWKKHKMPQDFLHPITSFAGKCRSWFKGVTLGWETPYRLATGEMREELEKKIAERRAEFFAIVDDRIANWDSMLETARQIHNGKFSLDDYPSPEEFRAEYGFELSFSPVPSGGSLPKIFGATHAAEIEERNQARLEAVEQELRQRILAPIDRIVKVLESKNPRIFETLGEELTTMISSIPRMNVTNNDAIEQMVIDVKNSLGTVDIGRLRESMFERKRVLEVAKSLQDNFGLTGRRKFELAA